MSYVIINKQFLLRGWIGLEHGVMDSKSGYTAFFPENVYDTLKLCNGRFKDNSPLFMGARKDHLKFFMDKGIVETLPEPASLQPGQEYRLYENRYMRQVHWSMTGHCNYRCRHCYMSAPHAKLPQPDRAECMKIIDEIASCGIRIISLTGGEALIRNDFLDLVDHILDRGIRIATIMSNGALVNEQLLRELEKRNCRPEFNMSFDGVGGCHDWLRGVEGATDAVERAFLLCRDHGFPTGSELVLHRGNAPVLRDSVKKLGEWGVSSLKVGRLMDTGEAAGIKDKILSCKEEYDIYLDYIPQFVNDGMPLKDLILSGFFAYNDGEAYIPREKGDDDHPDLGRYLCRSARMTMYLGPDGRILPCIPMSLTDEAQKTFPRIWDMSLKDALSDSSYMDFIKTDLAQLLEHNKECSDCEYKFRCGGGCRGNAAIANGGGDLLAPDPECCLFYKGGYCEKTKKLINKLFN